LIILLQRYSNVLSFGILEWISVISDESLGEREDGVVATNTDILAWEPTSAALTKDDVSGDNEFAWLC
jgi:hypothetical protein